MIFPMIWKNALKRTINGRFPIEKNMVFKISIAVIGCKALLEHSRTLEK